jgi:DNA polymerase III alpha subunit (gram-positive type)
MSIYLPSLDALPPNSVVLIYDLEAIGDVQTPETCFMWNLSAMVLGDKTKMFDQFIEPPVATIPEPPNPKLFKVTHEFLRNANARPPKEVLSFFFKWVANLYNPETGGIILMVSHANFRFDQPLMQSEIIRNQILVPPNVYFLDTLHWFRTIKKKLRSYSLSNLYKQTFNRPIKNAHLSLFDVHALHDLIQAQEHSLSGIVYHIFHTALLRIPQVGLFTERVLFDKEMLSVEHLVHHYRNSCLCNPQNLKEYLRKGCNIDPAIVENVANFVSTLFVY